jgi:hypothetical protein
MARVKKLTDSTYSPTIAASEEAIRTQIDDSIQEAHDLALEDVTINRKLSATGDFTGTINGGDVTLTEPGLSGAFNAHVADNVYVVKSSGVDDLAIIQAKIDSITVGTVLLPDVNYVITGAINLNKDNINLIAGQNTTMTIDNNSTGHIVVSGNNCIVKGFKLIGNGVTAITNVRNGCGIKLTGVTNCIIENNTFDSISGVNILLVNDDAVGCVGNVIRHNNIVNPVCTISDGSGIMLGYGDTGYFHNDNRIYDNTVDGNSILSNGIALICHGNDNIIENNKVSNCTRYGIISYESAYEDFTLYRTSIINNDVKNIGLAAGAGEFGAGIYLVKSHNSKVQSNYIENACIGTTLETLVPGAIGLNNCLGCNVSDNIIKNSNMYGIITKYTFESIIKGNIIDTTTKAGIYLYAGNDDTCESNNVKGAGNIGIKIYAENSQVVSPLGYQSIPTGKRIIIAKNIVKCLSSFGIYGTVADVANIYEALKIVDNIVDTSNLTIISIAQAKYSEVKRNYGTTATSTTGISVTGADSTDNDISENILIKSTNFTIGIDAVGARTRIENNYINLATTTIRYETGSNFRNPLKSYVQTTAPTVGTFQAGDKVWSNSPTEQGTAGSKYIITGYICSVAGTPGTWLPMRVLTGN